MHFILIQCMNAVIQVKRLNETRNGNVELKTLNAFTNVHNTCTIHANHIVLMKYMHTLCTCDSQIENVITILTIIMLIPWN